MSLKRTIFFLVLLLPCFIINKAWATHERAGYITFQYIGTYNGVLRYQITVVTYTKESSYLADRQYLTVVWGDGTHDSIPRINYVIYPDNEDIKQNTYVGIHDYQPASYPYQISMTDDNRIDDINNILNGNSVNTPLCVFDTMVIAQPNLYGYNNSPLILNPPIQFGSKGQTFYYNPNAYSPNGDSLSYELTPPKEQDSTSLYGTQSVEGYLYPDDASPGNSSKDTESLNHVTGLYTWAAPRNEGTYNVDMYVYDYRKINGVYIKIGCVDVDIEIIIEATTGHPPNINPIIDTCIVAGQTLNVDVTAIDAPSGQYITLAATGSPFEVTDSATFSSNSPDTDIATGIFHWATTCDDIQYQTYQAVITAVADYYSEPLYDQVTWNITVVPPPPKGLYDTATGNSIILNWQFTGWRKNGWDSLPPDTCDPASSLAGYTELTPYPIRTYTFTDNSVIQGIDYSYVVAAKFGDSTNLGYYYNTTLSIRSNAVCANLIKDVPIITNVSVDTTAVDTGKMYVAWSKPSKYNNNGQVIFDTTQYPGPYRYSFYRSVGFNGTNPKYLGSYVNPSFYLFNDSSFVDDSIDTKDNPYSYIVKFYSMYSSSDSTEMGTTNIASSIYLTLVGNNHIVTLTWKENVPWSNDSFTIYRQNHITKVFDSLTTITAQTYTDKGLENDTTYCYKLKSRGNYSITDEGITNPLINSSQINCTVPVDTTRPCAPTLSVSNDCNSNSDFGEFVNQLQWTLNQTACANSSILKFYIYYSPYENQPLQLIDSTQGPNILSYQSVLNNTLSGCYAVASEDSGYTLSYKSNTVCVSNCPIYNLPNVFTPNGDGHNDEFTPILPYQYIDHIEMHIFNRWGELVFQTTDPMIDWNGKNFNTGKECPDGVYYYTCDVYENTVTGVVKLNPPLKGYIQILR
jgi:gliding motility-associated-like protein